MLKRLILIFFIPFVLWGSDIRDYVFQLLSNSGDFLKSNVEHTVFLIEKKINDSNMSKIEKVFSKWEAFIYLGYFNTDFFKIASDLAKEEYKLGEPYYLAYMKAWGHGVSMDIPGAIKLYSEACEKLSQGGVADACRNLAWLIIAYKKDLTKGLQLLDEACYNKIPQACESYAHYFSKIVELVPQGYTYNSQDKDKRKIREYRD